MQGLNDLSVAIMGGDAREIVLAEYLSNAGAIVNTFGLPAEGKNIVLHRDPRECILGVDALILPVPGVNDQMRLHAVYLEQQLIITRELMGLLPSGTPVFVGLARQPLRELTSELGLELVELMKLDEVAILNAIPSAEGALQIAMEKMPVTIHGCNAVVLGFGRTGQTLAQLLLAMHAKTTVIARNPAQQARAIAMGALAGDFKELVNCIKDVDVIFNTVPVMVIDQSILSRLPAKTLIIDLASTPGGTDFDKARELGIEAILAPGLPGKVAPKTAGMILARVVPRELVQRVKK
ncbi:dipicolinate synthase subunit DpsA [Desulfotruncus alcoholivorax]|uniref:dipicolinate synthase subunit DpsA n=1 Tax=Desulfotruncus alcoholivorax TaxID=265477 RepID=UPI0004048E36|nr:dipicolinate synthase subunit DpsA [Desulfotruncus alcoholivorax]